MMLKSKLVDMNEFIDQKLDISESEEQASEEEESGLDVEEKAKVKEKKEFLKEVHSDSIQSSEDEEANKQRQEAKKRAQKMKNIKVYLAEKNKRSNAQKTAEIVNLFAVGDDNQITAEKLTSMYNRMPKLKRKNE